MKIGFKSLITAIILLTLMFVVSCKERESKDVPTTFENSQNFLEEGWNAYQAGDYQTALDYFNKVLARDALSLEAYSGKAWSQYYLDDLTNADKTFSFIISLATINNNNFYLADGYAGVALIGNKRRVAAEAEGANEKEMTEIILDQIVKSVDRVEKYQADYKHSHEPDKININALHVVAGQALYYLQYFPNAVAELDKLEGYFTNLIESGAYDTVEAQVETLPIDDDQKIFINMMGNPSTNITFVESVKATDGGPDPDGIYVIKGRQLLLADNTTDIKTMESVATKDTVTTSGDTLTVIDVSDVNPYAVMSVKDENGYSVDYEFDADNQYIVVDNAGVYSIKLRYIRKFDIKYYTTNQYGEYLKTLADYLFSLN